jgi:hypothetical protein
MVSGTMAMVKRLAVRDCCLNGLDEGGFGERVALNRLLTMAFALSPIGEVATMVIPWTVGCGTVHRARTASDSVCSSVDPISEASVLDFHRPAETTEQVQVRRWPNDSSDGVDGGFSVPFTLT